MSRILVIDDEESIRALLRRVLEAAGYEVATAANGEEGLAIYDAQPIDLVVTDILMPEKEGLECILELRHRNPAVRVIAISGGSSHRPLDVLEVARRFGARRTFWKPFELNALVLAVGEELADRAA